MLRNLTNDESENMEIPNQVIANFVLTVRNNYRNLPYHNWHHAVTVCHAMFCILNRNKDVFNLIERFSFLIACLCHDIDHRSMSNQFLKLIDHPMVKLYQNSYMEHHHIQLTLDILSRKNHDLLQSCSNKEKDTISGLIRDCIIATDLASYFENQVYLDGLLAKNEIDLKNPKHRYVVMKKRKQIV